MWNANESVYRAFENGDYVRVEGTTQLFQGAMQLIATRLTRATPKEVDPDDFAPLRAVEVDKLVRPPGRNPPQPHRAVPAQSWPNASSWTRRSWPSSPAPRPA